MLFMTEKKEDDGNVGMRVERMAGVAQIDVELLGAAADASNVVNLEFIF